MMALRAILYKMVWGSMALLILNTWTQCSSKSYVREVKATVKDNTTITCNYDTYLYKNVKRSWCRQMSETDCETITAGTNLSNHEPVYISQTMDQFGPVNVTIFNLQPWHTGLYNWRVWDGFGLKYEILQTDLLHVVYGLPPNIRVARFKPHETAELHCDYGLNVKKSQIWYKKTHEKEISWMAHSDGNKGTEYRSRIIVNHDKQKKRLTVIFKQLEMWDNGMYQCQETETKTILTEILLIVSMDNEWEPLNPADGINQSSDLNTYYSTITPQPSTLNNSFATLQPWSHGHNTPWNILRWMLFLCMLLCVVFFSLYKRASENIFAVRRIYNPRFIT